jgi:hypothetical protein
MIIKRRVFSDEWKRKLSENHYSKKIYLFLIFVCISIFLISNTSAAWNSSLNTNLVSVYNFDENTGTVANDVLGKFNTTFGGANPPTWITGKFGTALKFTGKTGDSKLDMAPERNFTNSYTFSFWLNYTDISIANQDIFNPSSPALGTNYPVNDAKSSAQWGGGGIGVCNATMSSNTWYNVVFQYDLATTTGKIWSNGALCNVTTIFTVAPGNATRLFSRGSGYGLEGAMDNIMIFNRTLTESEITTQIYNAGAGVTYSSTAAVTSPTATLIYPANNSILSTTTSNFTINSTAGTVYNLTNITYNIFYSNNTLFNSTTVNLSYYTSNVTNLSINGLSIGNYIWGGTVCSGNGNGTNCSNSNNNSFAIGAVISSLNFVNNTYETANSTFTAVFDIISGSTISLSQLVYNGTNYTITNITQTATTITLSKTIDIPLNINPIANQTNNFTFRFTYGGTSIQETSKYQQNASYINFQICNAAYTARALNLSMINELNQTIIDPSTNPTSFESSWKYWVGSGNVNKSYNYQNLSNSNTVGWNHILCIYPYAPSNFTFKVDGDIEYTATGYRENQYNFRNASLANTSSNVSLNLLDASFATKFFLTFRQGTSLISDATVTVQKFFTGLGTYSTVSILSTDDNGKTTMWQEVDSKYKYSIVKNGVLLGTVERTSICSVAPCELTIAIDADAPDPYSSYYSYYSQNILSNLSYNTISKMVTYDFIDITGLANYFRLKVVSSHLNDSGATICDSQSFSTAGSLSCNLTGYSGEFIATGYISRSPETVDKVLNFLTDDEAIAGLGVLGIFLIMGLLITIVFAAATIGKGSPSVVLGFLGAGILGLKIAGLFPFTWTVVVSLEVIILFIMSKTKV